VASRRSAEFSIAARKVLRELQDLESRLHAEHHHWDDDAQAAYWVFQKAWSTAAQDMHRAVGQLAISTATYPQAAEW
jgi:6 kDa early secretory antigenic target